MINKSQNQYRASIWLALFVASATCLAASYESPQIDTSVPPPPPPPSATDSPSLKSLLREQANRQTTGSRTAPITTTIASVVSPTIPESAPISTNVPFSSLPITTASTTTSTSTTTSKPQQQYHTLRPVTASKCHYNNQIYSIGQKWNDDCAQVCECVSSGDTLSSIAISACKQRCPVYNDSPGDGCRLERSKTDECCLDWACDLDGKFPPSTTTTIMATEKGLLNISTTEIKMQPSTVTPMASQQVTQTTTQAPVSVTAATVNKPTTSATPTPTTTTTTTSTTMLPPTVMTRSMQQGPKNMKPTTNQQQAVTTTQSPPKRSTQNQNVPTTTTNLPAIASNRSPKQVGGVIATQSPNSFPPKPHSLVTTTPNNQPSTYGVRMAQYGTNTLSELEGSQNVIVSAPTTTTSTTTTKAEPTPEPSLEEADPNLVDLCIQHDDPTTGYRLNQSWFEEPCNQNCRCVFRSEPRNPFTDVMIAATLNMRKGSQPTEIRCGLPPECDKVLRSMVDCPHAHLIMPQPSLEKCACPVFNCPTSTRAMPSQTPPPPTTTTTTMTTTRNHFPTSTTISTTQTPLNFNRLQPNSSRNVLANAHEARGCKSRQQGGRALQVGETFNDECHSTCRCSENGEYKCQALKCPTEPPVEFASTCAAWTLEPDFAPEPSEGKCCPKFVCKESAPRYNSCSLLNKEFAHGERLPEEIQPPNPDCEKQCICNDGKINCTPLCLKLSSTPPEDLNCEPDQAVILSDDCCPRWSCPVAVEYAVSEFRVMPLNETSVEIEFRLPLFAIDRPGKAELNYTNQPMSERPGDQPPVNARWFKRPSIRTAEGKFVNQITKYHLNNLKPDHKYWFKLSVHFQHSEPPFDEPMESQMQSVVMPPLTIDDVMTASSTVNSISVVPSTTTTTTTTVPPTIKLQPVQSTTHAPMSTTTPVVIPVTSKPTTTSPISTTSTTTTSTTSTTTETPSTTITTNVSVNPTITHDITKAPIVDYNLPCNKKDDGGNSLEGITIFAPLTQHLNEPLQRYAWHLLVAFSVMTILFTIVSYLYLRKSSRVIAPITSQSAYDNPTFTKLVSYYGNQPHVLLVDENNQNYNNDAILAKQKNLEVDKSSPLHHHHHHHQLNDIHHHNGRQHLI